MKWLLLLLALLCFACSDDDTEAKDAGADLSTQDAVAETMPADAGPGDAAPEDAAQPDGPAEDAAPPDQGGDQ
jgi:hypothetical protein